MALGAPGAFAGVMFIIGDLETSERRAAIFSLPFFSSVYLQLKNVEIHKLRIDYPVEYVR